MNATATKPTEINHTPGPWAVHLGYELTDGRYHPMMIYTDDGHGNGAAIPDRDDYEREWRKNEALANAALIAAAPSLLAALKEAERWMVAELAGRLEVEPLVVVRAAIAKAQS